MKALLHRVSAFCDGPLQGNPAGVCLDSEGASDAAMQKLAAEVGYAETAFPIKKNAGWSLRWFTPTTEVDLCGHATLATAWVLWQEGLAERRQAQFFDTRSGQLVASFRGDWVELEFPAAPPRACPLPPQLEKFSGRVAWVGHDGTDYIIELKTPQVLLALDAGDPAFGEVDSRALVFTAKSSNPEFDFVSRVFGPRAGIPEDPATGSSHCALGPYWREKLGKQQLHAWQASPKGGALKISFENKRVCLAGKARRLAPVQEVEL